MSKLGGVGFRSEIPERDFIARFRSEIPDQDSRAGFWSDIPEWDSGAGFHSEIPDQDSGAGFQSEILEREACFSVAALGEPRAIKPILILPETQTTREKE